MLLKNYYDLLGVPPGASQEELKRAFRQQIGRYHPDKVQHLGKEFQAMAADRAAELTEAYRILSDAGQRTEYDRTLAAVRSASGGAAATAVPPVTEPPAAERQTATPPAAAPAEGEAAKGPRFSQERARRDEFVRKATVGRFRKAAGAIAADYVESHVGGFDVAYVAKPKLFARAKQPCLLGCFVTRVDGAAVADAWTQAAKWGAPTREEICVFLMGSGIAPRHELEAAIALQRRTSTRRAKVTLIPVDASNWNAHVPLDAPPVAKNLLARLQGGT